MMESKSPQRRNVILAAAIAAILIGATAMTVYSTGRTTQESTLGSSTSSTESQTSVQALALAATWALPGEQGRIDHMGFDLQGGVIYVAGYGNDSVGVVDLKTGQLIKSITAGVANPQGVAFVPGTGMLYVSNGADGNVEVFDSRSNFTLVQTINFVGGDADNLRLDPSSGILYVGFGSGGIAEVNTTTNAIVREFPLPGHPESFQIDPSASRVFVNVPTTNMVEALDLSTGKPVLNHTFSGGVGNYPMALDTNNHRLFVGTRNPPAMVVLDESSLQPVANVSIPGDPRSR